MAGSTFNPFTAFGPVGLSTFGGDARTAGGRGTNLMPILNCWIELPSMLDPSGSTKGRITRVHNQACKYAMTKCLQYHHLHRIPDHFNSWKQKKYHYKQRSLGTIAIKLRRGADRADLVKEYGKRSQRGAMKKEMTSRMQIRIGGSAAGGQLTGTGILRFPTGFKRNTQATKGVTWEVMRDEMERWTPQEEREAAGQFMEFYLEYVNGPDGLKPRTRKKLAGRLGQLNTTTVAVDF